MDTAGGPVLFSASALSRPSPAALYRGTQQRLKAAVPISAYTEKNMAKYRGRASTVVFVILLWSGVDGTERRTSLGVVRGRRVNVLGGGIEEYRGIPYARPPVGELRFRPPVSAPPWEGILDAQNLRTACPQSLRRWSDTAGSIVLSEDCLYINVWTPVMRWVDDMAPMLVWIHGGGFTSGSSAFDNFTAATLAAVTGFVVASFNYRLGILGFLNADTPESPGNMGLMDQRLALLWLRRNARTFGGNPAMITVFGHSAGGMSVHSHLLSPLGQGLFRRAIMMSGNMAAQDFFESVQDSVAKGEVVAALVGCSDAEITLAKHPSRVVSCLRTKSSGELVSAAAKAATPKVFPFLPTFHTEYLPRMPVAAVAKGFATSVDIIVGVTANEGSKAFEMRLRPALQAERLTAVPKATLEASLREVVLSWMRKETLELLDNYVREAVSKESLREKYVGYLSDRLFVCPMHFVAGHHSARNGAVYSYVFVQRPPTDLPSWIGAGHSMELPYFFGRPLIDRTDFGERDVEVTEAVVKMLSTFAEKGVPELQSGRPWPRYTASSRTSMQITQGNMTPVDGFRRELCEPWLEHLESAVTARHCCV